MFWKRWNEAVKILNRSKYLQARGNDDALRCRTTFATAGDSLLAWKECSMALVWGWRFLI